MEETAVDKVGYFTHQLHSIIIHRIVLNGLCHEKKTAFCICENKAADQLHGYCVADQRLCFRQIDTRIPLLPKSEILSSSNLL